MGILGSYDLLLIFDVSCVNEVLLGATDNVAIHCANIVDGAGEVFRTLVQLRVQMSQILIFG